MQSAGGEVVEPRKAGCRKCIVKISPSSAFIAPSRNGHVAFNQMILAGEGKQMTLSTCHVNTRKYTTVKEGGGKTFQRRCYLMKGEE